VHLGLLSIATILKNSGWDVQIVDFDFLTQEEKFPVCNHIDEYIQALSNYIVALEPDAVGFYCLVDSFQIVAAVSRKVREKNIKIVLGGPHATICAEHILTAFPHVDLIGLGECEDTICDIFTALFKLELLDTIDGIAYRKNGKIICREKKTLIDVDTLPAFDYTLLPNIKNMYYMQFESGRGCPFGCSFCSTSMFWKRNHRLKSPTLVVDELIRIHEKYGMNMFANILDSYTINKTVLKEFCNLLKEKLPEAEWVCQTRADAMNEETLQILTAGGCKWLQCGVETGSQRMQFEINKNLNIFETYENIERAAKFEGIEKVVVNFILGFPGETFEDVEDTLKMIHWLYKNGYAEPRVFLYTLLPGTKLYSQLKTSMFLDPETNRRYVNNSDLTEEMKSWIADYPEIFSCFYSFPDATREQLPGLVEYVMFVMPELIKSKKYEKLFSEADERHLQVYRHLREFYGGFESLDIESGQEYSKNIRG
jgi:radical SAM superfamily enzyme YgiQ (UPF0313 family)